MSRYSHEVRSDTELLTLSREGDAGAFGALWERHRLPALVAAQNIAPTLDADDLVSDAYLKVFELIQQGKGPTGAFRPYLYRVISSLAADRFRSPETQSANLEEIPDLGEVGPWEEGSFDLNAAARAFESLPERWQSVLWYTEVEGLPPREIAPLLGISANSVSALAVRAREGLQSAWVEAHLNMQLRDESCRSVRANLQRYQRGKLTARRSREVAAHLDRCDSCSAAAAELSTLNKQLALVLALIFIGGGSATALLQQFGTLGAGATAGAAAMVGADLTGKGAATAGASGGMSTGATVLAAAASVALVAAAAGGAVLVNGALNDVERATAGAAEESQPPTLPTQPTDARNESAGSSNRDTSKPNATPDEPTAGAIASIPRVVDLPQSGEDVSGSPDRPGPVPEVTPPKEEQPPGEDDGPPDQEGTPPEEGGGEGSGDSAFDHSLEFSHVCTPGPTFRGVASEYGVVRVRATAPGSTHPVEMFDPKYDPSLEGTEPDNVFEDGVYTDAQGNEFDFGFWALTKLPYFWWSGSLESLDVWSENFPGLSLDDVTVEIRLVTPDGRHSAWFEVDTDASCF